MEHEPTKPSLKEDESGAIMVMGVFMAVFLVGMLYYIVGLGDAITYREHMQDTSDAGTFTAAVVNARGMNLIVMLNLIMAAIMAILLSLKLLEVVIIAAMGIAAAVGVFCGGCTAPAVTFLNSMRTSVNRAADLFEDIAKPMIRALHVGQEGIKIAWPAVGQLRAIDSMMRAVDRTPSDAGITFPLYGALPVENHEFYETCIRGAKLASDIVAAPFGALPVIGGRVRSWIASKVERLYQTYASYYCGDGDVPSPTIEMDVARPSTNLSDACSSQCARGSAPECSACDSGTGAPGCADAVTEVCYQATQEAAAYGPKYCAPGRINPSGTLDAGDGHRDGDVVSWCRDPLRVWSGCHDPDRLRPGAILYGNSGGAPTELTPSNVLTNCRQRAMAAATQCATGRVSGILFTTENSYIVYHRTSADGAPNCTFQASVVPQTDLSEAQRAASELGRNDSQNAVCPFGTWGPVVATGGAAPFDSACRYTLDPLWQARQPNVADYNDPLVRNAACETLPTSREVAISRISASNDTSQQGWRRVRVTEVHGCSRREPVPIDVEFGERASEQGGWEPPQRVCQFQGRSAIANIECPGGSEAMQMGADDLQIRGIAIAGTGVESTADQGTRVATWQSRTGPNGRTTADPTRVMPWLEVSRVVGQASISQAEFFWDQSLECENNNPDDNADGHCSGYHTIHRNELEWMWDMAWSARLRRVRLSSNSARDAADSTAGADVVSRVTGFLDHAFAH